MQHKTLHHIKNQISDVGFSLIELVIDITILGLLLGIIVILIDPPKQFKKARDARKQSEVKSLQHAFETYYHDHNCYPTPATIPWGLNWSQNGTLYMKKVPTGPNSSNSCVDASCSEYFYVTSQESCSQWYAVFAGLEAPITRAADSSLTCPLENLANCVPQGYQAGKQLCAYGGSVDCTALSSALIPTITPQPTNPPLPTATPTPVIPGTTSTPTPTTPSVPTSTPTSVPPTPTPTVLPPTPTIPSCNPKYACRGNPAVCNIIQTPQPGETIFCDNHCSNACP